MRVAYRLAWGVLVLALAAFGEDAVPEKAGEVTVEFADERVKRALSPEAAKGLKRLMREAYWETPRKWEAKPSGWFRVGEQTYCWMEDLVWSTDLNAGFRSNLTLAQDQDPAEEGEKRVAAWNWRLEAFERKGAEAEAAARQAQQELDAKERLPLRIMEDVARSGDLKWTMETSGWGSPFGSPEFPADSVLQHMAERFPGHSYVVRFSEVALLRMKNQSLDLRTLPRLPSFALFQTVAARLGLVGVRDQVDSIVRVASMEERWGDPVKIGPALILEARRVAESETDLGKAGYLFASLLGLGDEGQQELCLLADRHRRVEIRFLALNILTLAPRPVDARLVITQAVSEQPEVRLPALALCFGNSDPGELAPLIHSLAHHTPFSKQWKPMLEDLMLACLDGKGARLLPKHLPALRALAVTFKDHILLVEGLKKTIREIEKDYPNAVLEESASNAVKKDSATHDSTEPRQSEPPSEAALKVAAAIQASQDHARSGFEKSDALKATFESADEHLLALLGDADSTTYEGKNKLFLALSLCAKSSAPEVAYSLLRHIDLRNPTAEVSTRPSPVRLEEGRPVAQFLLKERPPAHVRKAILDFALNGGLSLIHSDEGKACLGRLFILCSTAQRTLEGAAFEKSAIRNLVIEDLDEERQSLGKDATFHIRLMGLLDLIKQVRAAPLPEFER